MSGYYPGMEISKIYDEHCMAKSDISAHLPLLRKYAILSGGHVTEMGVRDVVSTWAFLAAQPKRLVSIDWNQPPFLVNQHALDQVRDLSIREAGTEFEFVEGDSTKVVIEPTDLLFIDTWHTYHQLTLELILHSAKVRQYILVHDTNERCFPGMFCAIEDFLFDHHSWRFVEHIDDVPGLTVLQKVGTDTHVYEPWLLDYLRGQVEKQKLLYYKEYNEEGSTNPEWHELTRKMKDLYRSSIGWPITYQLFHEANPMVRVKPAESS